MPVRFQCKFCHDPLSVGDKFSGRKIRCPLCETPLQVPPPEPPPVILEQDFAESLERFKLNEWARAYATKAFELQMASREQLRAAVIEVRRAERKGEERQINEALLAVGAIQKSNDLALSELVKGAGVSVAEAMKECPGCFAAIPETAEQCPYCHQELGNLQVMDMCPNCKHEQPMGEPYCRHCGADIHTGLRREHTRPVRKYKRRPIHTATPDTIASRLSGLVFPVFCIIAIVALVYAGNNWSSVRKRFLGMVESPERAELYEAVRRMDDAIRYRDFGKMIELLDAPDGVEVDGRTLSCMLGAESPSEMVQSVEKIRHVDYVLEEDGASATVYTEVAGRYAPPETAPDASAGDLFSGKAMKIAKNRALGFTNKVAWKWIRKGEKWLYCSPLPDCPGNVGDR